MFFLNISQNLTTEIFDLFQKNWSYQQIADKLNISKSMAFALTKQNPQFEQIEQIKKEKQNQLINEVLRLHNEPNTYRQIATKLNITHTRALRIVKNNQNIITPKNISECQEDRHEIFEDEFEEIEDVFEPIEEVFEKIKTVRKENTFNLDRFSQLWWDFKIKGSDIAVGNCQYWKIVSVTDQEVIVKDHNNFTGICLTENLNPSLNKFPLERGNPEYFKIISISQNREIQLQQIQKHN